MKRNLLIITLLFLGSFVILLLGNIIIIGEKIASLSQVAWAEYAFYTLILVVFYAVVIHPVVRVHRAPQFPALSIDGEWNTAQLVAFGLLYIFVLYSCYHPNYEKRVDITANSFSIFDITGEVIILPE